MSNDGLLIEDLDSKFDAVIDMVTQMNTNMKLLATKDDLNEVKQDIKVIKAAVTDTSKHIGDHEIRITRLETA